MTVSSKRSQGRKRSGGRTDGDRRPPPFISEVDLARIGDGQIAYIKAMSSDEARNLFPSVEGLPADGSLFALHAADGTPIVLTDSHQAAVGHALEGELEIASIH